MSGTKKPRVVPGAQFTLGQIVYSVVNNDRKGIVVAYRINPFDMTVEVSWDNETVSTHYEFELTADRPTEFSR